MVETAVAPSETRLAGRTRRWLPLFGILAALSFLVFGGFALVVPLSEPVGPPVRIGDVHLLPLSGWEVAGRIHGGVVSGVRLARGTGNLSVLAGPFMGQTIELLAAYLDQSLGPATSQLAVSRTPQEVRLGSRLIALRVSYVGAFADRGTSIEGQLTALVSPTGVGVLFDAWAPRGQFLFIGDDVDRMVETTELG